MLFDEPGRFETIHARHLHIHHDQIGMERVREGDGLFAVDRLANNINIWSEFEEFAQPLAARAVVINNEHIHRGKLAYTTGLIG